MAYLTILSSAHEAAAAHASLVAVSVEPGRPGLIGDGSTSPFPDTAAAAESRRIDERPVTKRQLMADAAILRLRGLTRPSDPVEIQLIMTNRSLLRSRGSERATGRSAASRGFAPVGASSAAAGDPSVDGGEILSERDTPAHLVGVGSMAARWPVPG